MPPVLPNVGQANVAAFEAEDARLEDSVAMRGKLCGVLAPWDVKAAPVRQRYDDRRGGCGIRPIHRGRHNEACRRWLHKQVLTLRLHANVGLRRRDAEADVAE